MLINSQIIQKYFPGISEHEMSLINRLGEIYPDWNTRINLISRSDIEHLFERHILHSLAIAKFINFIPGTEVLDIGTGGGFPGIPLSIHFPEVNFTLVDSIAKKIKVVDDVIQQLRLMNAVAVNSRAENLNRPFDYVVSRATAPLGDLFYWSHNLIRKKQINAIPNGIICLKGGDLSDELKPFRNRVEVVDLSDYFSEDFFATKKLVFLPVEGRR